MKGLEPPRLSALDPKSSAATNYATSAFLLIAVQRWCVFIKSPNLLWKKTSRVSMFIGFVEGMCWLIVISALMEFLLFCRIEWCCPIGWSYWKMLSQSTSWQNFQNMHIGMLLSLVNCGIIVILCLIYFGYAWLDLLVFWLGWACREVLSRSNHDRAFRMCVSCVWQLSVNCGNFVILWIIYWVLLLIGVDYV